jgi:hypothetical protein
MTVERAKSLEGVEPGGPVNQGDLSVNPSATTSERPRVSTEGWTWGNGLLYRDGKPYIQFLHASTENMVALITEYEAEREVAARLREALERLTVWHPWDKRAADGEVLTVLDPWFCSWCQVEVVSDEVPPASAHADKCAFRQARAALAGRVVGERWNMKLTGVGGPEDRNDNRAGRTVGEAHDG